MEMRFVIGRKKCDEKKLHKLSCEEQRLSFEKKISAEEDLYGSFFRLDMEESYLSLNHKTYLFFRTAIRQYPNAKYFVKADDDIWLFPERLRVTLSDGLAPTEKGLAPRSERSYIGCFKKGPIFKDNKLKWYEPFWPLLSTNEYHLHTWGPIYSLSNALVADLGQLPDGSMRFLTNEDTTVGLWMIGLNATQEDDRRFCHAACSTNTIVVYDLPRCSGLCKPIQRLQELNGVPECIDGSGTIDEWRQRNKPLFWPAHAD